MFLAYQGIIQQRDVKFYLTKIILNGEIIVALLTDGD